MCSSRRHEHSAQEMMFSDRIYLRQLYDHDAKRMLEIRINNFEYFRPWDPPLPSRYFTIEGQLEIIQEFRHARSQGSAQGYGIFVQDNDLLIGRVALRNLLRGSLQSGTLGYFIDQKYANCGYTTEAGLLLMAHAYNDLKLHRIEASVMPSNAPSVRVLEKLGFRREGLARWYLFINNRWEDHLLFASTTETFFLKFAHLTRDT